MMMMMMRKIESSIVALFLCVGGSGWGGGGGGRQQQQQHLPILVVQSFVLSSLGGTRTTRVKYMGDEHHHFRHQQPQHEYKNGIPMKIVQELLPTSSSSTSRMMAKRRHDNRNDNSDDINEPTSSLTTTATTTMITNLTSDWVEAEWTLFTKSPSISQGPNTDLDARSVAILCCRSLQWVDYPTPLDGLERCYFFFTPDCREAVTARQGGKCIQKFLQYGILSPALQPFMGASHINIRIQDGTLIPAKAPLRGALWSIPVDIVGAPVLSLQHPSGMHRSGIVASPPITHMVLRLEQQRRPPNQGCWMVREILNVKHAFAGDMGNVHVGA